MNAFLSTSVAFYDFCSGMRRNQNFEIFFNVFFFNFFKFFSLSFFSFSFLFAAVIDLLLPF